MIIGRRWLVAVLGGSGSPTTSRHRPGRGEPPTVRAGRTPAARTHLCGRRPWRFTQHRSGMGRAMKRAEQELPALDTFEAVVAPVADAAQPTYVRFAPEATLGRGRTQRQPPIRPRPSGCRCRPHPRPPSWWTGRPLEEGVRRRYRRSAHRRHDDTARVCWLVSGREAGRGPDNEPLLAPTWKPLATIADRRGGRVARESGDSPATWREPAGRSDRRGSSIGSRTGSSLGRRALAAGRRCRRWSGPSR